MNSPSTPAALSVDQLVRLHALTKDVSSHCLKELQGYVDTLAPLFRPRRFLGNLMEGPGPEPLAGADRNFAELQQLYKSVARKTFDVHPDLNAPVESVATQMHLYEWEYTHEINTDRGWRSIRVTAPLTWVLTYSSHYSLAMIRQVLAGKEARNEDSVRAFVLRACVAQQLFVRFPGLADLFTGLRYRVEIRRNPQLGDLPFVTLSAPLTTMRPDDNLVNLASGIAGGTSFTEVIDLRSLRGLEDPVRSAITPILGSHGE